MFDGLFAAHLFGSVIFADEYFIFGQIEYLSAKLGRFMRNVCVRNCKRRVECFSS